MELYLFPDLVYPSHSWVGHSVYYILTRKELNDKEKSNGCCGLEKKERANPPFYVFGSSGGGRPNKMRRVSKFTPIKAEQKFWDTRDAIEVLGGKGWKVSEPGTTIVTSLYVARVETRGAVIRIPREWLASIGAKKGRKIKAQVKGKRLVMELA